MINNEKKRNSVSALFIAIFFILTGCEDTNWQLATEAGLEAVKAVTLSDREVHQLAARAAAFSDSKNRLAEPHSPYTERLMRLTKEYNTNDKESEPDFNYKVYISPEINAFAMADGTIRVYSGLMDLMDDPELLFVIGHEQGHVIKKHIKKKMIMAYAGSAIRKGVASQQNIAGEIAASALGGFIELLLHSQFSQQEEREADDYGLYYLEKKGRNPEAGVSALKKLESLGGEHSFLSTHPAPGKRAKRLEQKIKSKLITPEPISQTEPIERLKKYVMDMLSSYFPGALKFLE